MYELYMEEINKEIQECNYIKVSELFMKLIQELLDENDMRRREIFYEYGMFLFELREYESALIMLKGAYEMLYKTEEIKGFVYDCFIEPNKDEFEVNYKNAMISMHDRMNVEHISNAGELMLDFIPISEKKYMIFDKRSNEFGDIIDFSDKILESMERYDYEDEFSDLVLVTDGMLKEMWIHLIGASDRKIYCVTKSVDIMLSYLKLHEIAENYFNHVYIFDSLNRLKLFFNKNSSTYLPRIFLTSDRNMKNNLYDMIKKQHVERIRQNFEERKNIILSICIPTFNRGHRALQCVKELIKLPYDAEMEIVVSNNGSTEYTKEYEELKAIQDSRITYLEFEKNQGFAKNMQNVMKASKGKYSLIISDEDTILPTALPYYFKMLSIATEIAFGSAATSEAYAWRNSMVQKKGTEALDTTFSHSNISGLIYNNDLFRSNRYMNELMDDSENEAVIYYPHLCWELILHSHGDFCQWDRMLVQQGIAEKSLAVKKDGSLPSNDEVLPYYASLESRLAQMDGFIQIICKLDFQSMEDKVLAYYKLCWRTFKLIGGLYMAGIDFECSRQEAGDKIYRHCLDKTDELGVGTMGKEIINQLVLELKKTII